MKKRLVLVAVLALCCMMVVPPAWALKVGAVFSVTGRASFLGDPEKKTAELLVAEINAAGGINGEKIDLTVYDDEGDATKCNLAVKKLITRDKVDVLIGPSTSGNSMAVLKLAEQYKVPMISCAASYKIVHNKDTGKPYKWVFKTPQTDSMAVEAIFTHLQSKGISKIAIMSVTSGFGASGRGELLRLADQYKMTILADEKYGPKDNDMTVQLTKVKGKSPQAIVNWSIGPTQVVVLRNWRDLNMTDIPFYQSHGFGSKKNIELASGAAEGVMCPLGACNIPTLLPPDHPQKSVTMAYAQSYDAKFKEPLSSFGGHAWDAISLIKTAMEAGAKDRATIRDAVEKISGFVGQHGVFNFSADDHNGLDKTAFNMVVVKDGDWALAK